MFRSVCVAPNAEQASTWDLEPPGPALPIQEHLDIDLASSFRTSKGLDWDLFSTSTESPNHALV